MAEEDVTTDVASDLRESPPVSIAGMPVTGRQRNLAYAIIAALALGLLPATWFAAAAWPRADSFVPAIQTVICAADLVTAYFLFTHYSIEPRRALLALAGGYMFSGLFALLQSLEFPGAYSPFGLLGGGPSAASWLFFFWNTTFALSVISYVRMSGRKSALGHPTKTTTFDIGVTAAIVLTIVAALTWLGTAGNGFLPALLEPDLSNQKPLSRWLVSFDMVLLVATLALVVARTRTVLDVWLTVTLFAALPNVAQGVFFTAPRYTVLWYVARCYTLIASCTVLAVLLTETTMLYTRLSSAMLAQRRERIDRLMNVRAATAAMIHEIRQPLSAIVAESDAALAMLDNDHPNIEDVREAVKSAGASALRVNEVLSSTGGLFKGATQAKLPLDLNDLTRQVLQIVHHDLASHRVAVTAYYAASLPLVRGDRTQLQQVILNLIRNAIEAMDSVDPAVRHLRLATTLRPKTRVVLSVRDSGPGIKPAEQQHIFDAFYTTKPAGTGLGLAICQSILEDHGGALQLTSGGAGGCIFEVVLPAEELAA